MIAKENRKKLNVLSLSKYYWNGNLIFQKILSFPKYYIFISFILTENGGIIGVGRDNDRLNSHIIKLDRNGELEFVFTPPHNTNLDFLLSSIYQTSDGNYIVCGSIGHFLYLAKVKISSSSSNDNENSNNIASFEVFRTPIIHGSPLNIKFKTNSYI